jgi:hypothetical protein
MALVFNGFGGGISIHPGLLYRDFAVGFAYGKSPREII